MEAHFVAIASSLALAIACGSTAKQAPFVVPPATVRVAATTCITPPAVEARLLEVLASHRAMASGLAIDVKATPSEAATSVVLRVVRSTGEVGLDRSYTLTSADCESVTQLLALSVDRWLSAFPEWAEPPLPPAPPPSRWNEVLLEGAINGIWPPIGADAQLATRLDHGGRHDRFGGSILVRGSIPQRAGRGRFQQTSVLAGASWRHRVGAWETRIEARAGALLVNGLGFAENDSDWLVWWEGAAFGGRRLSWGTVGLEISATALQHTAVTRDRLVSEDIPMLRIGISGSFGLRTKKP